MKSIADHMEGLVGGARGAQKAPPMAKEVESEGGEHSELHPHGDGSYHTITSDGERTEHPHITHATAHLAAHHEAEGKHIHAHSDGMEHTTSQAEEGGGAEGPHNHENIEALKQHMGQFLDEEEGEGGYGGGEKKKAARGESMFE